MRAMRAGESGQPRLGPSCVELYIPVVTEMGDKSEAFCRQAVVAFNDNREVLPRNFSLEGFRSDLVALDALRPVLARVFRLYQRPVDTEMALGSDLMNNALEGYAVLKVAGKGEGLDIMRNMLSARFNRRRAEPAPSPEPQSGGEFRLVGIAAILARVVLGGIGPQLVLTSRVSLRLTLPTSPRDIERNSRAM